MRGPFSSLYGNASGGVIQLFTADGPPDPTLSGSVFGGSYGTYKGDLQFGGTDGRFNYNYDGSRFHSDGYREHSTVTRDLYNAKLKMPRAERQLDGGGQCDRPAGDPGPARPFARAIEFKSAPGRSERTLVQHAQKRAPEPDRLRVRHESRRRRQNPGPHLYRRSPGHAVPGNSARGAVAPQRVGRRRRPGFRLRGHRPALDAHHQRGRAAAQFHRRRRLRPHGAAPHGLYQQFRHSGYAEA